MTKDELLKVHAEVQSLIGLKFANQTQLISNVLLPTLSTLHVKNSANLVGVLEMDRK